MRTYATMDKTHKSHKINYENVYCPGTQEINVINKSW